MSNYKETDLAGTSYVRASSVRIQNGEDAKSITFEETEVINLSNGDTITKSAGSVSESLTAENATTPIALLDPRTGADTGKTITYQDLYAIVYSLYFKLATERDQYEAEQLKWEADRLKEAEDAADD